MALMICLINFLFDYSERTYLFALFKNASKYKFVQTYKICKLFYIYSVFFRLKKYFGARKSAEKFNIL